ncbi:MAG: class B sortase [Lachnospiraceae bacterium]|nr:class B sortase [Lachnospiraceae bacterium]
MAQKIYIVEGRQFRTEVDYNRALHDKEIMERLRKQTGGYNATQLRQLKEEVHNGKYKFLTLLGQDFEDELDEMIKGTASSTSAKGKSEKGSSRTKLSKEAAAALDEVAREELKRQEKRRKQIGFLCSIIGIICLSYFGMYLYYDYKTRSSYEMLSELKEKPPIVQAQAESTVSYTRDTTDKVQREVLDEYKNLLNKNKKLIGWIKIDDTNIDYPVMQTSDNEYYLDHNLNQEYDKNGSIFMDKDCDVVNPSTNYILYGHHMKSGKMFGDLDEYSSKEYYEEHPYIQFDTIYEKGTYQVMYVFRSRVYSEEEIVFKYYQFIDAFSEQEFNSNMQEMAALSLYDTGVTAEYGDRLLTLSTCDYQEEDGRFVVVAKKIAKE